LNALVPATDWAKTYHLRHEEICHHHTKGESTMMNHHRVIDAMDWKRCTCCGLKIRLLGDPQNLVFFMDASTVQRRGFQCANCGQVTCYQCSAIECRCTCNSNAWVAMPYVEPADGGHPEQAETCA